jgi:hypothetical protein
MPAWRLENDLLSLQGLRVRVHRIGLAYWRADQTLRSWAVAPLHGSQGSLHAPCGSSEALWLGAWLDEGTAAASVRLANASQRRAAAIALPGAFQLTALTDEQGLPHAIVPAPGSFVLELSVGGTQVDIPLTLHAPAAWAALSQRAEPAPLSGPPPLPPRLG